MAENPVIKEIPVYLTQALAKKLVLYQYPLEKNIHSTENRTVKQCSVKENPHEVQLELEINTQSTNFCVSKAEQIAINVDGKPGGAKKPEDTMFPRGIMDTQTLQSRALQNQNAAAGILHENEVHITPLTAVTALRPTFKHLDASDKRIKTEAKEAGQDLSEEEEEVKQVTVRFARQESERTKKAREKTYGHFTKMTAKEIWYKSNYFDANTDKSEMEVSKLYCQKPHEKVSDMKYNPEESSKLFAKERIDTSTDLSLSDSLKVIRQLPLLEKIKKLLLDAKVLQFNELKKFLRLTSADIHDSQIFIQQVGVLVQGCWVINSDVLYSKEVSSHGIPSQVMKNARDYILYLFTRSRTVNRNKIVEVVKLPPDIVKEILEEVSELNEDRQWEFRVPTDGDFIKNYPDLYERQYLKWSMKYEQLMEGFKNAGKSPAGSSGSGRTRRKSFRASSISSDSESTPEAKKSTQPGSAKVKRVKKQSVSFGENVPSKDSSGSSGNS